MLDVALNRVVLIVTMYIMQVLNIVRYRTSESRSVLKKFFESLVWTDRESYRERERDRDCVCVCVCVRACV